MTEDRGPLHGIVLVLGARGSGKTLLLQELEYRGRRDGARFVRDRMGHWSTCPRRIVVRSDDVEEAAARAIAEAPCTLVVDEAALAIPSDRPPPRGSAVSEILFTGRQARGVGRWRRRGPVSLLAAAQRPATVHASLRGLLDRLYWAASRPRPGSTWSGSSARRTRRSRTVARSLTLATFC